MESTDVNTRTIAGPTISGTNAWRDNKNDFNDTVIAEFRANDGRLSGPFANTPILLLTTIGTKSGRPRTTPVCHTHDGDRIVIVASKAGAPTNPDWYYNLLANPVVTVERGAETFQARASVIEGEQRKRLYDRQAALMPGFAEYQKKTTRPIPVVILERVP